MTAYRTSTKIKLGLIVAAVAIAVASLVFTQRLADRVERQDAEAVELWARAVEFQSRAALRDLDDGAASDSRDADGLDFVFTQIVEPARFSVPAVITDAEGTVAVAWRHVPGVPDDARGADAQRRLLDLAARMDARNAPIRLNVAPGLVQVVHYGDSPLARMIRWFPFVQLGVVALFVLVGYLGFSYVRRSEQAGLWVGMAREAAHQLGTPLTSLIGWTELLRLGADGLPPAQIAEELDRDIERLQRVAHRFEKIGSTPDLTVQPLAPVLDRVADYVRRRLPQSAPVALSVEAPADLQAALNAELFEWVVENLLKNAMDAMEGAPAPPGGHRIAVRAALGDDGPVVDVRDTGRGMDRATARHVFRPGFSTKRRGWGLGLSLARRIVEDYHGGTLAVAGTRPSGGTTFRIELPPVAA